VSRMSRSRLGVMEHAPGCARQMWIRPRPPIARIA
jgi:hypothetical protein